LDPHSDRMLQYRENHNGEACLWDWALWNTVPELGMRMRVINNVTQNKLDNSFIDSPLSEQGKPAS
jgi:hypothetical protein